MIALKTKYDLPPEVLIKTILGTTTLKVGESDEKTKKVYQSILHFASNQKKVPNKYIQNKLLTPLKHRSDNYDYFFVPKSTGRGIRLIANPKSELREIQSYIKDNILEQLPISEIAMAYIPKEKKPDGWTWQKAVFETAGNRDYFGEADIKSFFDHMTATHVYNLFKTYTRYSTGTCRKLTNYCTNMGTVPQGSITGPTISNLIMYQTDLKLQKMLNKQGWTIGRYSDNFMFGYNKKKNDKNFKTSKKQEAFLNYPLNTIRRLLLKRGFQLHEEKCWVAANSEGHPVMNLSISQKLNIPAKTYNELRNATYNFVVKKRVPIQYKGNVKGYYISLKSKLSYWTKIAPKVKKTADILLTINPQKIKNEDYTYVYNNYNSQNK